MHGVLPPAASVLELGCGTGRIADPLAALGHEVVGVDSSAAMLTQLRRAHGVRSSIEGLDLGRRFDAVLLGSHLVNTYDPVQRAAFLAAARRHLSGGGRLVLQRHPPGWRPSPGASRAGDVELELCDVVDHGGGTFSATLVHRWSGMVAEQDVSTTVLDDEALAPVLVEAGFDRGRTVTADGQWVVASAR